MNIDIQPHSYVWIASFLFFWKCGQVNGSQTKKNTWKEAVLDCYGSNSFLESNVTILKKYMRNNTEVKSIWVGGFEALLPWIEIRGCYIIPPTRNSLDRDELITENPDLCQLKCMKRQYFAFNPYIRRCVCFDDQKIVKKESLNASLCNDCSQRGNCNIYTVAYKDLRSFGLADNGNDCLSYQCKSQGAMPIFDETQCTVVCESYCRDGRKVIEPAFRKFFQYRKTCEEDNFNYPLLYSENPVNLCNLSQSHVLGIDIWVGVYRQRLTIDKLDETVLQAFTQIEKNILKCKQLSINDDVVRTKDCDDELHYICTQDSGIKETDNQNSGLIAGTVTSMLVTIVVVVIVVVIYRRRLMSEMPKFKDKRSKEDQNTNNTNEMKSDEQYHEIDIALGPYSFAKPLADTDLSGKKEAENENEYSRIVSAVYDASHTNEETNNCIANSGYNEVQINNNKTNPVDYPHSANVFTNKNISADYCLAKPITDPEEMDPYTDNADYDHLSNVKNREDNTVKVYDHVPNIIDSDVTYDHSTIHISKLESDNYDHFDVPN